MTTHIYTRAAEQHRRNAELGPAHIARPLRRIQRHRADVIAGTGISTASALRRVVDDSDYRFFQKAARLGLGHVVTAGARALL